MPVRRVSNESTDLIPQIIIQDLVTEGPVVSVRVNDPVERIERLSAYVPPVVVNPVYVPPVVLEAVVETPRVYEEKVNPVYVQPERIIPTVVTEDLVSNRIRIDSPVVSSPAITENNYIAPAPTEDSVFTRQADNHYNSEYLRHNVQLHLIHLLHHQLK